MSLYNAIKGFSPATYAILPMLEIPYIVIPRYRDCFVENNKILVFTRVGGGNRNCGFGEEILLNHPNFVETYDWEEDSTYGIYEFSIPSKWKKDFDRIITKQFSSVSDEYVEHVNNYFPKLRDSGAINKLFGR